jgi:phage shock protein A
MGIMTRMLRLCKADVHGVMDQLEDKELLLKQYLREMETSLGIKEQQVRALTQRITRLNRRIAAHREEADKLERDLTLALKKEKDDIARMLIRKRRVLAAASVHLSQQVKAMTQEKEQLSETLAEQRLQYETLNVKADAYGRRAGERLSESGVDNGLGGWGDDEPGEEEIELELLERKEALQKGDTP